MSKVLVAMSGGVDSSVAAYLIKQNYDCIGATMKLFNNEDVNFPYESGCCSQSDVEDAKSVAYNLGIPHYVFNFTADFKSQVIDRFVNSYENGFTPNPCIDCNRFLKFNALYRRSKEIGYDYISTGHYARIEEDNGRFILKKARDLSKDQSYVLYSMTQDELKHTLLPLGNLLKAETREIAEKLGFINADKPDSQDICFVQNGKYADFIKEYTGKIYPKGNFVDDAGNVLGVHQGIICYTIGQRKGLGIACGKPMYVSGINPKTNEVVLSAEETLFSKTLNASGFNWIAFSKPPQTIRAKAKIRYKQDEKDCKVNITGENTVNIEFDKPQRAITKGQAVVIYEDDVVIGGGIIN